jgi:hypothetical protein
MSTLKRKKTGCRRVLTRSLLRFSPQDRRNIGVDETKIHASKHGAVSYSRAAQIIEKAEKEVGKLPAKAEEAAGRPLEEVLKMPEEIMNFTPLGRQN